MLGGTFDSSFLCNDGLHSSIKGTETVVKTIMDKIFEVHGLHKEF